MDQKIYPPKAQKYRQFYPLEMRNVESSNKIKKITRVRARMNSKQLPVLIMQNIGCLF